MKSLKWSGSSSGLKLTGTPTVPPPGGSLLPLGTRASRSTKPQVVTAGSTSSPRRSLEWWWMCLPLGSWTSVFHPLETQYCIMVVVQDEIASWGTTTQFRGVSIPNWCLSCILKQPLWSPIRPAASGYEIGRGIPWSCVHSHISFTEKWGPWSEARSHLIPCQWI